MYSWGDDMSNWRRPGAYKYDDKTKAKRARAAKAARSAGPRTYGRKSRPDSQWADPKKSISTKSRNPLVVAVDVTGSMKSWPGEIFDRLPLLYQTLSQYRPDLQISFVAIGDAECDKYPFQVTDFTDGYLTEKALGAIYGEGGGNDDPAESFGLLAWYLNQRVSIPDDLDEKPFVILFADVTMQPKVTPAMMKKVFGLKGQQSADAIAMWQRVCRTWDVHLLSRPGRLPYDQVDSQWAEAIGAENHVHIHDPLRAVDYALGLVARQWNRLDDFRSNMLARQDQRAVDKVLANIG